MTAQALDRVVRGRTAARAWWARERLTGATLFLITVRWLAWLAAALIVALDVLPQTNVDREPYLLIGTFATTVAFTVYLPLLRPRVRALFERSRWSVNDILLVSLLDVILALAVVFLSGGWDSPYYLYALVSLLVPASLLERRWTMLLILGFVGAYALVVATGGDGVDGPWRNRELNNYIAFLTLPLVIAIIIQFFGWMSRELARQRGDLQVALDENLRLQAEREQLAAEQERDRIAREIHDGVSQSIYMLSLSLEAAADEAAGTSQSARLSELVAVAKQTLLEVRHYIFDLRPLLDGQTGVAAALRNHARELTAVSGLPVAVDVIGDEVPLPPSTRAVLYRVSQEALANVFRHAQAGSATVRLAFDADAVTLEITDDGAGTSKSGPPGRGINGMRQRSEELGGSFDLSMSPSGTTVRVSLPIGVSVQ